MHNTSKMLIVLIFVAMITCLAKAEDITYRGLMQVSKKAALAKDLVYILKTIFQNAKFYDYPDVKEEEGSGALQRGLYMTDIDVIAIIFDEKTLANNLTFTPAQKKISLETTAPILKYIFHFKWRIEAFGVHIGYGEGNATMTSNKISAYYSLPQKSEISSAFEVKIVSLTGANALSKNIEKWLNSVLNTKIYPKLLEAIKNNEQFITEYMHAQFKKIDRRIGNDVVLSYISVPDTVSLIDEYFVYAFNTSLYIENSLIDSIEQIQTVKKEAIDSKNDFRIFHSGSLIPVTLKVYGKYKQFDHVVDPTALGLSGTIADLIEAMPELESKYSKDAKIIIQCEYPSANFEEISPGRIEFIVKCKIITDETKELLLDSQAKLLTQYDPAISEDESKLFVSSFADCKLVSQSSKPSNPDIGGFLSSFYSAYGQAIWLNKKMGLPRLRYEPLREYVTFSAKIDENSYIADYLG